MFLSQLFFTSSLFAADDGIIAKATVDKNSIFIGDKITYTLEVAAPAGVEITFPQFAENLAGFAIKDFGGGQKKKLFKKEIIYKQWYVLDTYVIGKYEIPQATIRYRITGARENSVSINKIAIEVKSVLALEPKPATDIKDIKSPLYFPKDWKLWISICMAVFLAAAGATAYFRGRKAGLEKALAPPPAWEIAYKALQELKESHLLRDGFVKEYFFRLSFIVRQYLENRFNLRAPEMTTEEFLAVMKGSDKLSRQIKTFVTEFLEKSDLVKFAKYGPTAEEILGAFDAAKRLVDETKECVF